jgi:hypothetical protein
MSDNLSRSIIYDQNRSLAECDTWAAELIITLRAEVARWQVIASGHKSEVEFEKSARRDEESWWKEQHDYKQRAEQAEAELAKARETLRSFYAGIDPIARKSLLPEHTAVINAAKGETK